LPDYFLEVQNHSGLLFSHNLFPLIGREQLGALTSGNEVHCPSSRIEFEDLGVEDCRSDLVNCKLAVQLSLPLSFVPRKVRVNHDAVVDDIDFLGLFDARELQFSQCGQVLEQGCEQAQLHDGLLLAV